VNGKKFFWRKRISILWLILPDWEGQRTVHRSFRSRVTWRHGNFSLYEILYRGKHFLLHMEWTRRIKRRMVHLLYRLMCSQILTAECCKNLLNTQFHNFYSSPNITEWQNRCFNDKVKNLWFSYETDSQLGHRSTEIWTIGRWDISMRETDENSIEARKPGGERLKKN
jgi:hypothetical protein